MARTKECTPTIRLGRLRKAQQFLSAAIAVVELADDQGDVADACVTLCVHAGIAASDVICCVRLGRHAGGENHNEAIDLLELADNSSAKYLATLLGMKTRSGYSHAPASSSDLKRATRAAEALVEAAVRAQSSTER